MATLAPTPGLRGREVELRELGDAFGRLAPGHPSIVLVEGAAANPLFVTELRRRVARVGRPWR